MLQTGEITQPHLSHSKKARLITPPVRTNRSENKKRKTMETKKTLTFSRRPRFHQTTTRVLTVIAIITTMMKKATAILNTDANKIDLLL